MAVRKTVCRGWFIRKNDFTTGTQATIKQLQIVFKQRLRIRFEDKEGLHISTRNDTDQQRLAGIMATNPDLKPGSILINQI